MNLQEKYKVVLDYAKAKNISYLEIREQNNVLYIDGVTTSEEIKDGVGEVYHQIDPDMGMGMGDIVLNIEVGSAADTAPQRGSYTVRSGDSLSDVASKYPGVTRKDVFEANKDQISDLDQIESGQVLEIPSP